LALTNEGNLFAWGFNVYGQLGTQDKSTRWYPEQITAFEGVNVFPRISKVKCSYYASFAIDDKGVPYACGKGPNGHLYSPITTVFTRIVENTENRIFTDVFTN
jgi:alpha-tubulin suppressor-like RCC1 family protein